MEANHFDLLTFFDLQHHIKRIVLSGLILFAIINQVNADIDMKTINLLLLHTFWCFYFPMTPAFTARRS